MNIKNHEIIHEISRGAISTVYKARHLNLNRPVLLKVLNPQWLGEKDLLKRFKREAQISAHLQHPNIVNVYDFETSDDLVFISLEYIEGKTLSQFIREENPVPFEKAISIFNDLLNALHYAHKKGVLHRDIKPDNILIDKELNAQLTDFGLAAFKDTPSVTEQGQSMGTPAYMAPEQIEGRPANIQTDLYSLGITLFELLTNESPFLKENTAATLQSILSEDVPKLSKVRPDAPEWIAEAVKWLTAKQRNQRPKGASEVIKRFYNKKEKQDDTPQKTGLGKPFFYFSAAALIGIFLFYFFMPNNLPEQSSNDIQGKTEVIIDTLKTEPQKNELTVEQPITKQISKSDSLANKPNKAETIPRNLQVNKTALSIKPEPGYGTLFIKCSPWAKVILDGDSVDTTPMKQAFRITEGRHQLELSNPNYKSEIRTIEINANSRDTLNIRLKINVGYLIVKATPWAKLFINDVYKEDTPLKNALVLKSGQNILKLVNPNLGTITDTIFVEAGKTIERHFTFKM
jgi:serine/threonine protein kinase